MITTTYDHPFYVKGKGFLYAGELEAGEEVIDSEGSTYAIETIYFEIVESPETVYNFQYIVKDGNTLILSTRTSQEITQEEYLEVNGMLLIERGALCLRSYLLDNYPEIS